MITRAGLLSRIALGEVLLRALIIGAQAAPIPIPVQVQASPMQILPATAPVPNVYLTQESPIVHLPVHFRRSPSSARGIYVHDVHDSSVPELARRRPGHPPPPPPHQHPSPPPAHHDAPPPSAHHNAPPPSAHHNAPPPQAHHNAAPPPPPHHNALPPAHHDTPPPAHGIAEPKPAHHHESIAAKIRHAFHRIGEGISHAVHAVKHFIQDTGAKIAKVGLKIVATAQKIASKAIGMLPGIGKPLGRLMEGESEGLNKASNAIHAHIGGKLGQAMHRMDHAQKIVGYIPRSHILERFDERERSSEFEERELDEESITERGIDVEEVFMF